MNQAENEKTVRKVVEDFNRKDLEGVLAAFAEDAALHEPFIEDPIKGADALRDFHKSLFSAFPDETMEVVQLIADDSHVVARTIAAGSHTGEFLGMKPTGRRFSVPECLVYEFDDLGLIVNQWTYVDSGSIAKQFGYGFARGEGVVS